MLAKKLSIALLSYGYPALDNILYGSLFEVFSVSGFSFLHLISFHLMHIISENPLMHFRTTPFSSISIAMLNL